MLAERNRHVPFAVNKPAAPWSYLIGEAASGTERRSTGSRDSLRCNGFVVNR
jgi:hypothetical protein